jgi:hypothetical protein
MAFVFTLGMGVFPISASEQNTSNNTFYVETEKEWGLQMS